MPSSGMLRRVAPVRTDVSEELSASIINVTRIGELGTTLAVTSNRRMLRRNTKLPCLVTMMIEALRSSETLVLTGATRRNVPEDAILQTFAGSIPSLSQLTSCTPTKIETVFLYIFSTFMSQTALCILPDGRFHINIAGVRSFIHRTRTCTSALSTFRNKLISPGKEF
jgi:hypothetical protein